MRILLTILQEILISIIKVVGFVFKGIIKILEWLLELILHKSRNKKSKKPMSDEDKKEKQQKEILKDR